MVSHKLFALQSACPATIYRLSDGHAQEDTGQYVAGIVDEQTQSGEGDDDRQRYHTLTAVLLRAEQPTRRQQPDGAAARIGITSMAILDRASRFLMVMPIPPPVSMT